jgi:hypothetical protein
MTEMPEHPNQSILPGLKGLIEEEHVTIQDIR